MTSFLAPLRPLFVVGSALCLAVWSAGAQQAPHSDSIASAIQHAIPVPTARAVRRSGPIVLDAKLDEPAWQNAPVVTEFTQYDPDEGKPPTERTEVRFLYDDDALYIGAKMYDTAGAAGVMTRLVRRDDPFDSDYLEIVIDGYHDHLSRAFFDLNPSGSKGDQLGIGTSCCDVGWDPVWEAATHIDADGWTAEIRIPFSQLRYGRGTAQTWGLQIRRFIKRRQEEDDWSFWHKNETGGPARFGHLVGLEIPASTKTFELLPYVVETSKSLVLPAGDPFGTGGRPSTEVGLDLKDRLTSNLTVDATFNPDFGQVELDPAVLNLSAYETFYPEKRPFFVAGSGVFDFGNFNCYFCSNVESMSGFYSRRVGRAPTGADLAEDNYLYADVPDATPILGAAKLTGRTNNGFTVGVLDAVTGQADARVESADGVRGTQEVEPLANYFVGRLKRDFLGGNLVVGGITSIVTRRLDTTFAPRLASSAGQLGGDLLYTWSGQAYSLRGTAAISDVNGDPEEITLREESSARYFQRPDRGTGASGFLSDRFDTTATDLRGAGLYARLGKDAGDWLWETAVNARTPGYETNDYAYQQKADYVWYDANLQRNWLAPGSWYHNVTAIIGGQQQHNFEGDVTSNQLQAFMATTTPQFWSVSGFNLVRPASFDDRELRGGPVVRQPFGDYYELDLSSDSRRAVVLGLSASDYWNALGERNPSLSFTANYRPTSAVSLQFLPSWSLDSPRAQYDTAIVDPTAVSFYGARYVVATLHQRTLALDSRVNLTLTPSMTLQVYAHPFFASGHYFDFKEYATPRTDQLLVYGRDRGTISTITASDGSISGYQIDPDGGGPAAPFAISNPDFNSRSLQGNAVFRWEFRPGSTAYLAWTQTREYDDAAATFAFQRDERLLLATRPDNIFLLKLSWWVEG